MKRNSKKTKKIIPLFLMAVPLMYINSTLNSTDAAEGKSVFNLKLLIFNGAHYESAYDTNGNNSVDVFDMIRLKQKQYNLGSSGLENAPEVTSSVTSVVSETSAPVTSEDFSDTTTEAKPVSTDQTTASVITEASSVTSAEMPVSSAAATETTPVTTIVTTAEVPVTTTVTMTEIPVTTTTVTTTEAPVTTTTVTTTEAPVTTTVTTTEAPVTTPVTTTLPSRKIISSVRSFVQGPELPTGCEATGLAITIRWYGYDVSKTDVAMKYMPRQDFRWEGSRLIGADFRTTFAGDPSRNDMSYGCYIPCMVQTVNNYFKAVGSSYRGKDISGKELEDLFPYVAQNIPVVLISTPELMTPRTGDSWYTEDGRYVTWQRGHHCMVLIGYDKINQKVYCADPMMRAGIVSWNLSEFKSIYNQKGKNAMIIDTGAVKSVKELKVGDTVRFVGYANSASDGNGGEVFLETNLYTITQIHPDRSLPYPVCIGNIGWVSLDAIKENVAYFGDGNVSGSGAVTEPQTPASNVTSDAVTSGKVYNIVNKMSGKYLNVNYGIDTDGSNIYQWTNDGSTEQKFKMSADGEAWKIMAMCSSGGANRMVTASETNDGKNVYLYKSLNNVLQQWTIKKIKDNTYCIGLKAYPGYVLTVPDSANGTGTGTSSSSAGNVYISKYTGADNQLWYFSAV